MRCPRSPLPPPHPVLLVALLLLLALAVRPALGTGELTPAERRARAKKLHEQKESAWSAAYKSSPQRERRRRCEGGAGDGPACVWEGLQVSLSEGSGLQACADCDDVHMQGLWGA
jgi:hypothetical protein